MEIGQELALQTNQGAVGVGNNLPVINHGGASLHVFGTFSATVTFEASQNGGVNWYPVMATNRSTNVAGSTATAPGIYEIRCAGVDLVRANVTGWVSGAVSVTGRPLRLFA